MQGHVYFAWGMLQHIDQILSWYKSVFAPLSITSAVKSRWQAMGDLSLSGYIYAYIRIHTHLQYTYTSLQGFQELGLNWQCSHPCKMEENVLNGNESKNRMRSGGADFRFTLVFPRVNKGILELLDSLPVGPFLGHVGSELCPCARMNHRWCEHRAQSWESCQSAVPWSGQAAAALLRVMVCDCTHWLILKIFLILPFLAGEMISSRIGVMAQSDFKPSLMAVGTLLLSFTNLSAWLEIQCASTAKGEGWVPLEEIQTLAGFCFFW